MPTNETHAPYYIKGKIATPVYPAGHSFRLYFQSGVVLGTGHTGDEENWLITNDGTEAGTVQALLTQVGTRLGSLLPATSKFQNIEIWQSIPDAPNTLVHLNPPPTTNSFGSGTGIASSYTQIVYGTALRPIFRFTAFDGSEVAPQRYAPTQPTVEDDDSLDWIMIRSPYGLANNDGIKLTRKVSSNTGYNKALARRYGRAVTP